MSNTQFIDYYGLLGVPRDATESGIMAGLDRLYALDQNSLADATLDQSARRLILSHQAKLLDARDVLTTMFYDPTNPTQMTRSSYNSTYKQDLDLLYPTPSLHSAFANLTAEATAAVPTAIPTGRRASAKASATKPTAISTERARPNAKKAKATRPQAQASSPSPDPPSVSSLPASTDSSRKRKADEQTSGAVAKKSKKYHMSMEDVTDEEDGF